MLILLEALEEGPVRLAAPPSVVQELTTGAGSWITGCLIDLTQLRLVAARRAGTQAVKQAVEHRAVIEQAKGMLMLTERLTADAAFAVLVRMSQETNTKLHMVAARLVSDFAAHGSIASPDHRIRKHASVLRRP